MGVCGKGSLTEDDVGLSDKKKASFFSSGAKTKRIFSFVTNEIFEVQTNNGGKFGIDRLHDKICL